MNEIPSPLGRTPATLSTSFGRGRTGFRLLLSLLLSGLAAAALAQTPLPFTLLHRFGNLSDVPGFEPRGTLVWGEGGDNRLYGISSSGEFGVQGTLFRLWPDGTGFEVLKWFTNSLEGARPMSGMVLAGTTLYGTTSSGGTSNQGTVFRINTDGTSFTVLRHFIGADGSGPGALTLADGKLYGMTYSGGQSNFGTLFRLNTNGSGFGVIKHFVGADGRNPDYRSGVVLNGSTIYATAGAGGTFDKGVVFRINTDGSGPSVLKHFNGTNGQSPVGFLALGGATLYGVTAAGGAGGSGTIFKLGVDGNGFDVLRVFNGPDGSGPQAGLLLNAAFLYGTTAGGGTNYVGTVFKVSTNGSGFEVLHHFDGSIACNPEGGLWTAGLMLYGTTVSSKAFGNGTVFRLDSAGGDFAVLKTFTGVDRNVTALVAADTSVYGAVGNTVFHLRVSDGAYTVLKRFSEAEGTRPVALVLSDDTLYGVASEAWGGLSGTVFKLNTDGSNFMILKDFTTTTARDPNSLILSGTTLYGTTFSGGTNRNGTLFKLNTDGTGFVLFEQADLGYIGYVGPSSLVISGSTLYGTISISPWGSATPDGSIFKINTDFTGFQVLKTFSWQTERGPCPGLAISGSTLFGSAGTDMTDGVLFRIQTDGSGYRILKRFPREQGEHPTAGPILEAATLYGTTAQYGSYYVNTTYCGTVFCLDTNGNEFTVAKRFTGLDGRVPGPVVLLVEGELLGATSAGSDFDAGAIYLLPQPRGFVDGCFTSAAQVAVTASNFNATGRCISLGLGYNPLPGTELVLVSNTGFEFIAGPFLNLAQGQEVALSFGGTTYNFVANYFGGSGNDLVLTWANQRPYGWGNDYYGQLGDNLLSTNHLTPVSVTVTGVLAGRTVVAMSVNYDHSLALCSDGTVAAWGQNAKGQLGDNKGGYSGAIRPVPVAVDRSPGVSALFDKTVVSVAAGSEHSLALCSDGLVAAWGDNTFGQVGDNTTARRLAPVPVNDAAGVSALAGKTVVAIAAGHNHSLALCSDGTLAAWGANNKGQLGDNTTLQRHVPVAVNAASGVSALSGRRVMAIAAGYAHSLALCTDGAVVGWGDNSGGQLGDNTSATNRLVPVEVNTTAGLSALAGKQVVAIAAGVAHSLAQCSDGTVAAWGYNLHGQLGDGTTVTRPVPVAVDTTAGLSALYGRSVEGIAAGANSSFARCADGITVAWGANPYGELGDNSTIDRHFPVVVDLTGLPPSRRLSRVFGGAYSSSTLALVAAPAPSPVLLSGAGRLTNGAFQFVFTNQPGAFFMALTATDPALAGTNWTSLFDPVEVSPGQFRVTDPAAAHDTRRFYRVRSR